MKPNVYDITALAYTLVEGLKELVHVLHNCHISMKAYTVKRHFSCYVNIDIPQINELINVEEECRNGHQSGF